MQACSFNYCHQQQWRALQRPGSAVSCKVQRRKWQCPATVATERQVFQLYPTVTDTCILDVKDAYEVCSLARSSEEKKACYAVFGLDAGRVEKYYDTVVVLEESLSKVPPVEEDPTPLTVKVFTMAVNVAAAVLAFVIALSTVLSTMMSDNWRAQQHRAVVHK